MRFRCCLKCDCGSNAAAVTAASAFQGPELLVIGGVAALLFGPSRLPELGKSVGKTVKSFQSAAEEFKNEVNKAATEEEGEGAQVR